jgi:preprotein translocase subunit YajC
MKNEVIDRVSRVLPQILALAVVFSFVACAPQADAEVSATMSPNDFVFATINFICMAMIVYFLLVLNPSKARDLKRKEFLEKLTKGDEVVTSSGIYGRVTSVKTNSVTLEIAPNVKIKVDSKHIEELAPGSDGGASDEARGSSSSSSNAKTGNTKKRKN